MSALIQNDFPILSRYIEWGVVKAKFKLSNEMQDYRLVSNVSIIPFIGDKCVMIKLDDGRWELIGGTLEPKEDWKSAVKRELMEEAGAELLNFTVFGHFKCVSSASMPYRSHIPHPNFIRYVGYGDVKIIGEPLNPHDGEKVIDVEVVSIDDAVNRFNEINRDDIAELYKLANLIRNNSLY
ncbi:NUDIX domain-containing protein [Paenibacillus alkalitolerans]|uniref:NUDIX domain-containing protein n=1 Tax=Paenibacillus alkalitolerans TaxID=2799335 RepID=UPI0018F62B61|nr:NUDIX domain-containing protein [Paenibacillus alkalitolerans]